MITWLVKLIMESKMIKTSAASAVGSGLVVIGIIDAKTSELKTEASKDREYVLHYVDARHDKAIDKINVLIDTQKDIKLSLDKIDDRLYNINKKLRE
jgi:hypothetical protein